MFVRGAVAVTWANPVAVAIAWIAAARRVVVPFAPIHFVAAAVAAATRAKGLQHGSVGSAEATIFEAAGTTLTAARAATRIAASIGVSATTSIAAPATGLATTASFTAITTATTGLAIISATMRRTAVAAVVGAGTKRKFRFTAAGVRLPCELPAVCAATIAATTIGLAATARITSTPSLATAIDFAATIGFATATAAATLIATETEKLAQAVTEARSCDAR